MLQIGDKFSLEYECTDQRVRQFAEVTGDKNPVHLDAKFAEKSIFGGRIVHGMLLAGAISRALGCDFPGAGTIYMSQKLKFLAPVFVGETIHVELKVAELKSKGNAVITTTITCNDKVVVEGEAFVKAPRGS
jgi:3-hydroxybutyryl-CoA dehydratase